MKRHLIWLALALLTPTAAMAQGQPQGRVITTCGSPPVFPTAGSAGPFTVDASGLLCISPVTVTFATEAPITPGAATATKSDIIGCQYNSTQATFANGQQGSYQCSPRGALYVVPGAESFAVAATLGAETTKVIGTVNQGTSPWVIAGAVTNAGTFATQSAITAASGSVASGAFASGSIASGAVASGAYASGAFASGAFASGSFASGSQAVGITPTDRTVTSATGASQTVMSANATRKTLTIVNTGNANCGVNPTGGTAAIGGAGTITLAPLGSYTPRVPTLAAVTAICTAAQPLYADEG